MYSVDSDLVLVRLVGTLLLSELGAIGETGTLLLIGPCCTGVEVGIDDVEVGDGTGKAVVFAIPMYVGVCGGEGRGIEPNFNYKSCEVVCLGSGGGASSAISMALLSHQYNVVVNPKGQLKMSRESTKLVDISYG